MLKLKHLFINEELAKMLLKNWEYDVESLNLFKLYKNTGFYRRKMGKRT